MGCTALPESIRSSCEASNEHNGNSLKNNRIKTLICIAPQRASSTAKVLLLLFVSSKVHWNIKREATSTLRTWFIPQLLTHSVHINQNIGLFHFSSHTIIWTRPFHVHTYAHAELPPSCIVANNSLQQWCLRDFNCMIFYGSHKAARTIRNDVQWTLDKFIAVDSYNPVKLLFSFIDTVLLWRLSYHGHSTLQETYITIPFVSFLVKATVTTHSNAPETRGATKNFCGRQERSHFLHLEHI